jgi:hypothetical protein
MNRKANILQIIFFIFLCTAFLTLLIIGGIFLGELRVKQTASLENPFYSNQSLYPNPKYVKGDILERNKTIICQTGYSSTVRDVPLSLRKKIFERDGVKYPQPTGNTELDHFIPLCVGGSNDESNLWVEFKPYYKWKDRVEVYLCKELCSTNQTVDEIAQKMWNWYEIYQKF